MRMALPMTEQVMSDGAHGKESPVIPDPEPVLWAFEHFYHMDKANASFHCSPVKFSPITFKLYDYLWAVWRDDEDITAEMAEVKFHQGKYDLDPGR